MKKLLLSFALLLPGCGSGGGVVTRAEYDQIQNGMTLPEVEGIIGATGEKMSEAKIDMIGTGQGYAWKNKDGSDVVVVFLEGKSEMKVERGLTNP